MPLEDARIPVRIKLAALWTSAMSCYIYGDYFWLYQPGKLPASLNPEPLQEENIGPTLGEDTIAKGITAIIISLLVVPIFMLLYYRFAGLVAWGRASSTSIASWVVKGKPQ